MRSDRIQTPLQVLRARFGYSEFRPGQEALVRAVLAGRDALGVLPTGGGKTVCYLVPAMILEGLVVVITPLISLMADQVRRAKAAGLAAEYMSANQTPRRRAEVRARVFDHQLDVLFVSPERLDTPGFLAALGQVPIEALVVDEAHCIAEWGHDFRPAYQAIGRLRDWIQGPCLALTATATPGVRGEIRRSLRLSDPLEVVQSFDRPNLGWAVQHLQTRRARGPWLCRALTNRPGPAIVYCPSRAGVEAVGRELAGLGWPVGVYHAGLSAEERDSVQTRFMAGHIRVVAATNAFGMGIDKADIRTVIHLALPRSLEAFYQEAGRGGRDGEAALSVALISPGDLRLQRALLSSAAPPPAMVILHWMTLMGGFQGPGAGPISKTVTSHLIGLARRASPISMDVVLAALARTDASGPGRKDGTEQGGPGFLSGGQWYDLTGAWPRWDELATRRRAETRRLKAVWRYVRARTCRRNEILRYFGEIREGGCGGCDRCGGIPELPRSFKDGQPAALKQPRKRSEK